MPRWLAWLRGEQGPPSVPRGQAPIVSAPTLRPELPANVDGAVWASWQARWQEF